MKSKSQHQRLDELCAEARADDGIPPHVLAKQQRHKKTPNNARAMQLCHQAQHALQASLVCDCDAPELADAELIGVSPTRGTHALVVTVAIAGAAEPATLDAAHAALVAHAGTLRAAIAAGIHRKRVPTLRFVVNSGD